MNRFEKVITVINNSCDKYRFYLSEAEIGLIAKDLLTSGIFENKIIVDELKQGDTFKWGEKEYIKLDAISDGCLCLAKDVWFCSKFDNKAINWVKSQLRGDIATKVVDFIPDINKLMLFDRDLTTDDGLTDYGHCNDNVSMLTCDEYRKYRKYIPVINERQWTITATTNTNELVRGVDSDGSLNDDIVYYGCGGVRPLICLDRGTLVEVEE
jgi:hypothetical protein